MGLRLEAEIDTNKGVDMRIVVVGIIFFSLRTFAMTGLMNADGSFDPRVLHTSNFVHLCWCISLMGGLRFKPFNAAPLTAMPTMLISIIMQDIPIVFLWDVNPIYKLYYALAHIPVFIFCFYLILARRFLLSRQALLMGLMMTGIWFLFIDDKVNGTLNGWTFFFVGTLVHTVWTLLVIWRMPQEVLGDTWIAPVIKKQHIIYKMPPKTQNL